MRNKKVLIISSEVVPYLPQTEQAVKSFQIPKTVNEKGGQTEFLCQDMDLSTKEDTNYTKL